LDGSAGVKEKISVRELVTMQDGTEATQKKVLMGDDRFKIVRSPNNPFSESFGRYA